MRAMGEYKRLNAGVEPVGGESIVGGDQEERGGGGIHYFRIFNENSCLTKNLFYFVVFFEEIVLFSKEDNTHLGELSRGGRQKQNKSRDDLPSTLVVSSPVFKKA